MNIIPLSIQEQILTKCNYVAEIDYTDLTDTAGTAKTLDLFTDGQARDIVDRVLFDLVTPFDGGATSELTVKVGYNGASVDDDDAFIEAKSIHVDATEIFADAGSADASTVDGTYGAQEQAVLGSLRAKRPFAAQETFEIEAVFTSTGANLTALTAGKLRIYFNVLRLPALRNINNA